MLHTRNIDYQWCFSKSDFAVKKCNEVVGEYGLLYDLIYILHFVKEDMV